MANISTLHSLDLPDQNLFTYTYAMPQISILPSLLQKLARQICLALKNAKVFELIVMQLQN